MQELKNFVWKPHWVSHLGCLLACKDYLGLNVSDAALFGGSGHAFMINIHEVICPSGPTAWKSEIIFKNIKNLGLSANGYFCWQQQGEEEFSQAQRKTWDLIRKSIDDNLPCYCWYLDEYFVINGYDETGYYVKGPGQQDGIGPVAWEKLGREGVTFLEAYCVNETGDIQSPETIVHDAFQAAVAHAHNTEGWIVHDYRSGIEGFDLWIEALEQGKASVFGNGYNAQVWCECRAYAVEFLEEFTEKLSGRQRALAEEALTDYRIVSENMTNVAELYPMQFVDVSLSLPVDETSSKAVEALKIAREAEGKALEVLERFCKLK